MSVALAMLVKPFVALVIFGLICLPIRLAAQRFIPDGVLKRILLLRLKRSASEKRRHQPL
jgi:hypothetical protein